MGPQEIEQQKNKVGVGRQRGRFTLDHIVVNEAES